MGIFYNIPRFPRYFYRFSVRSVSLKIKLIVIPGLLYGFSKYPLAVSYTHLTLPTIYSV